MKNNISQFKVQGSNIIKRPRRLTARLEAIWDCGHDVMIYDFVGIPMIQRTIAFDVISNVVL